jgi:RNA polymerase sigma-70 factor (ECF subfamily)
MPASAPDTDELLNRTAAGDQRARDQLLERHRQRLGRMVAVRMDPRLAGRVDPSDVVQEALAEAAGKLDAYLDGRPLPFYAWLRRIAWERLVALQRRHVYARRRSVGREEPGGLPEQSALELAERLFARGSSPSRQAQRGELRERVRAALAALPDRDREVLVLRYLEGLSNADAAAVLGVSEGALRVRHVRAIERLRGLLGEDSLGGAL